LKKKIGFALLIILSCFTLSACTSSEEQESTTLTDEAKYEKALKLYEETEFEEAKELFASMDYKDSTQYVTYCTTMAQLQGMWYLPSDYSDFNFEIIGFTVIGWPYSTSEKKPIELDGSSINFINSEDSTSTWRLSYSDSVYTLKNVKSKVIYEKAQ